MALNLEKQLRFYGAYHHDPVNIGIHVTCVPVILLTAFALATNTGPLLPLPSTLTIPHLPPNLGTILCLAYSSLYILLEPVAGTALSLLLLIGTAAGDYLVQTYSSSHPVNTYLAAAHVISWIAQFVGHGKFEGRAPALLDNLFQAVFLAPLFVWLECLFALGYRPELRERVEKLVAGDVRKFREEKEKTKTVASVNSVNGHAKSS